MFCLQEEGTTSFLSCQDFENKTGFSYVPHLAFPKWREFIKIVRKITKQRVKGDLPKEQLWLGSYFKQEILFPSVPSDLGIRWINAKIGWGIFALKDLKEMTYVGEYAGVVRKKRRADSTNGYCFEYRVSSQESQSYCIDASAQGSLTRLINHSSSNSNLNVSLATVEDLSHIIFFTKRSISKGEQLVYDYGPLYWKSRPSPEEI